MRFFFQLYIFFCHIKLLLQFKFGNVVCFGWQGTQAAVGASNVKLVKSYDQVKSGGSQRQNMSLQEIRSFSEALQKNEESPIWSRRKGNDLVGAAPNRPIIHSTIAYIFNSRHRAAKALIIYGFGGDRRKTYST